MSRTWLMATACLIAAPGLSADELSYRYDGDVLPYDPSAGWLIADPCEPDCEEGLSDGNFTLFWPEGGDLANYDLSVATDPVPPPPSMWVEWRLRSNHPFDFISPACDASFFIRYAGTSETVQMYGDAAISQSGGDVITGLDINEFHTYRFESPSGVDFRISVDGTVFITDSEDEPSGTSYFQLRGIGGCGSDNPPNKLNEWDFVRYGTLNDGEDLTATDPPVRFVDPDAVPDFDRFTVTFDQPAYVYLDDITVSGSEAIPPQVIATRRRDNGEPETLEFLLDRPLIPDETVTFTFDDGATVNAVTYTYSAGPPIPAVSEWSLVVTTLLLLVAGTLVLRTRRAHAAA